MKDYNQPEMEAYDISPAGGALSTSTTPTDLRTFDYEDNLEQL